MHKVRSGQAIQDAVEDIISRSVGELRQNAFGEDLEDAKSLSWTREQGWTVLKQLARKAEVIIPHHTILYRSLGRLTNDINTQLPYYDVLANFPFKGDELALRSMEHAELISVGTLNGELRPLRPCETIF